MISPWFGITVVDEFSARNVFSDLREIILPWRKIIRYDIN